MVLTKKAQEAVDAVSHGALAVFADKYLDQVFPRYIVFEKGDGEKLGRFLCLLNDLNHRRNLAACSQQLADMLDGTATSSDYVTKIFFEDTWIITPVDLLKDEASWASQEEDDEWMELQRAQFAHLVNH